MAKINIAFLVTNCKKNGPIKQTLNIIKYMDRKLFEPILITIWPEEESNSMLAEYKKLNIQILCIGLGKKKSIIKGKKVVASYLKELKIDIVYGVGMPLYKMSLGYKKTVHMTTLRNYCYEDYPDRYGKIIGNLLAYRDINLIKRKIKTENTFVTCSNSLRKIYKSQYGFDFPYISNGVDTRQYEKRKRDLVDEKRKKLGLPLGKYIFVYSGSFIDRKNQVEAIQAFLKMKNKDSILLLLGDGSDLSLLKATYGHEKRIFFYGNVTNVNEFLNASDVYLSTSKSEGLPNGVLEAMACGLPVLLSDIEQHMEILEKDFKCGYFYKLGNGQELSEKMDMILNDDLYKMGEHSYNVVINNFTAKEMSKKYQDFYIEILNKKRIINK